MNQNNSPFLHGTTILTLRRKGEGAIVAGDGQVSIGNTVVKNTAQKVRRLNIGNKNKQDKQIITGFAGATADAFTLFERLEIKLQEYSNQLIRACVELAKDWRSDRYLRRLEAMLIVVDADVSLVITGNGDVLEPENGLAAIGSGGNYALAAAKALIDIEEITIEEVANKAMQIAAGICIYTNNNITIEKIDCKTGGKNE